MQHLGGEHGVMMREVGSTGSDLTAQVSDTASVIERHGYVVVRGADLPDSPAPALLDRFASSWRRLPLDTDLVDGGRYRYRRYGRLRAVVSGADVQLHRLPHAAFRQDTNPLYRGRTRLFAPMTAPTLADRALRHLLRFDLLVAERLGGLGEWEVGLHQIRIVARNGDPGKPTPEGRHRDGHLFVGMHLVNRQHCDGGVSIIEDRAGRVTSFTLTERLDTVVVNDQVVLHEVTPTIAAGSAIGIRDMLLVDLNPFRG
jgi:hypothetical protein